MKITNAEELPVFEKGKDYDAKKLYSEPWGEAIELSVFPGQTMPMHLTPTDVLFYVLRGRATVMSGDEKACVKKGDMIESPRNTPHGWQNDTDSECRVLVIKMPRP